MAKKEQKTEKAIVLSTRDGRELVVRPREFFPHLTAEFALAACLAMLQARLTPTPSCPSSSI